MTGHEEQVSQHVMVDEPTRVQECAVSDQLEGFERPRVAMFQILLNVVGKYLVRHSFYPTQGRTQDPTFCI